VARFDPYCSTVLLIFFLRTRPSLRIPFPLHRVLLLACRRQRRALKDKKLCDPEKFCGYLPEGGLPELPFTTSLSRDWVSINEVPPFFGTAFLPWFFTPSPNRSTVRFYFLFTTGNALNRLRYDAVGVCSLSPYNAFLARSSRLRRPNIVF